MNLDEFFAEAEARGLRLERQGHASDRHMTLGNEALFQLPFLAIAILTLSKGHTKPALSEIGQLVGECVEKAVVGFKGSPQDIGWSANLRIRTVKALTFLEVAGLVVVNRHTHRLSATEIGRQVFERAARGSGSLALAISTVERAYQDLTAEAQIRLRLQ
jgi:hypothetical protein